MRDGILYTGVPTESELKNAPGIPAPDEIKPGGTAFIECLQTIACNPCEANCPTGAITIGREIASRPRLDAERQDCISAHAGDQVHSMHNSVNSSNPHRALPVGI